MTRILDFGIYSTILHRMYLANHLYPTPHTEPANNDMLVVVCL